MNETHEYVCAFLHLNHQRRSAPYINTYIKIIEPITTAMFDLFDLLIVNRMFIKMRRLKLEVIFPHKQKITFKSDIFVR